MVDIGTCFSFALEFIANDVIMASNIMIRSELRVHEQNFQSHHVLWS